MSSEMKIKQANQVITSTFIEWLQVNILKSDKVIPNSDHFCIMGSDRGSGKRRS